MKDVRCPAANLPSATISTPPLIFHIPPSVLQCWTFCSVHGLVSPDAGPLFPTGDCGQLSLQTVHNGRVWCRGSPITTLLGPAPLESYDPATSRWTAAGNDRTSLDLPPGGGRPCASPAGNSFPKTCAVGSGIRQVTAPNPCDTRDRGTCWRRRRW